MPALRGDVVFNIANLMMAFLLTVMFLFTGCAENHKQGYVRNINIEELLESPIAGFEKYTDEEKKSFIVQQKFIKGYKLYKEKRYEEAICKLNETLECIDEFKL